MEVWLSVESPVGEASDVCVEFSESSTVAELATALAPEHGTGPLHLYRLSRPLSPTTRLVDVNLHHGDRIAIGPPRSAQWMPQIGPGTPLVVMNVRGGPSNGSRAMLAAGTHLVGRGQQCHVQVPDDALSREHFVFEVRNEQMKGIRVTVSDVGSSNGVFVDGKRITENRSVGPTTVIEAGHSLFSISALDYVDSRSTVKVVNGQIPFNRPPRMRPKSAERIFRLDAPPDPPEPRRLSAAAMVGPLLLGLPMLAFGLFGGNTTNTALVGLGAASIVGSLAMAVFSWFEDRRTGKGGFAAGRTEFRNELKEVLRKVAAAGAEEIGERRRMGPDAAALIERARTVDPSLWERRPDDPDYLHVSVGWGDQLSAAVVELGDGGDEQLRTEALTAIDSARVLSSVPIVVDIGRFGVVGLSGPADAVDASARWIVAQLATLQSPRDLVIAGAVATDDASSWSFLTWLPHLRSDGSPIEGSHLAVGEAASSSLFEAVNSIIRTRREQRGTQLNDARKPLPSIVLLVSERLRVPRASVTRILEEGPGVGVYVVWLGSRPDALPGECGVIVEVKSLPPTVTVAMPNLGSEVPPGALDQLSAPMAAELALLLAPLRDVTAGGARGQVPRVVSLPELLGLSEATPEAVVRMWQAQPFGVRAPIGVSAGGPFEIDMRHDGPHALVGGTTGAGKSELLQTIVASLAANHPPDRLTFLLVDYKGGAAFKDAVLLPHTVGFVTDLDGHLVHRALVSLNAELRYREHLMRQFGVKDLIEMERRFPDHAPPSLLLVVDEFASLAKELPEFVDGVVNVAQRGRALGIHMILATQRPAGSINDNIRANTNLRIALRFNDEADSQDVIGQRDAAMLPRTLKGRAFARLGQGELTELQVAYAGGHSFSSTESIATPLRVFPIRFGEVVRPPSTAGDEDLGETDLQMLVSAVTDAARLRNIPAQRPPWMPALPSELPLADVPAAGADMAVLGMADLPDEQAQRPSLWDLDVDGNLLVFGASGTGKTTLLRTIALDLAQRHTPGDMRLYALDFATRGLAPLASLPHVGSVISGDDVERVQRLIVMMEREVASRKNAFAGAAVASLGEYRRAGKPLPRIVILLDGYGAFTSIFEKIDFGEWIERLTRLVGEGRPVGIHWVLTADRRAAVGLTLLTTVGSRVILRMADEDEYSSLGLDARVARGADLPAGRCFVGATTEVQLALPGPSAAGEAQVACIEAEGARLRSVFPSAQVPAVGSLPASVAYADLVQPDAGCAAVGIGQSDLATVWVRLADGDLLVAGPNRSGRSAALATLARSIAFTTPNAELFALTPRRSPLNDLALWAGSATSADSAAELLADLAERMAERDGSEPPIVIVVDDGNELTDTAADGHLERLLRRGRDAAIHVVAAAESAGALRTYGGWIPQIRRDRRALLLNPDADIDGDLVGVRLPRRAGGGMPPGRGYLCLDGRIELVQVGL